VGVTYVDRWLKCPGRGVKGTVLDLDAIHAIRYLYSAGYTRYRLAKDYQCSWKTINNVVNYRYRFAKVFTRTQYIL
jgi:hypothetical protein